MGTAETKSKAKKKAAKWFAEEKKLQAQSAAARAKLNMMLAGDKVVGTATAQAGAAVDRIESARGFSADQLKEAQVDADRIDKELTIVSAKLNAARAAKSAGDSVADATKGVSDTVSGMTDKMKAGGRG
jgi:hypothetical protein